VKLSPGWGPLNEGMFSSLTEKPFVAQSSAEDEVYLSIVQDEDETIFLFFPISTFLKSN